MLDRTDAAILSALQNNARLSNKELAHAVGLAPSSCHERVRRLHESGILRGAHARVDPRALGIELEAMIGIRLRGHSRETLKTFRAEIEAHPEVVAVYYLSGATDFLIHVAVSGTDQLRNFTLDVISARPEVARVETSLIFDYARHPELPNYATPDGERHGTDRSP